MRIALCLALAACAEHVPSVEAPQPRSDPRWFCSALVSGDLAAASAAAAARLSSTGAAHQPARHATLQLRAWLDMQACIARAQIDPCSPQRITLELQAWTKRRPALRARVGTGGRVVVIDRTHLDPGCEIRFLE